MYIKDIDPQELTNVMKQYYDIKIKYDNEIVMFQLGDFFEMFFEDALKISKDLELTLTGKKAGLEKRIPMCGIPLSTLNDYLKKMIELGYTVVVVEQVDTGTLGQKLVQRKITKIISKGTYQNDSNDNNYIGSLEKNKFGYNLAYGDCSTGELFSLSSKDYLVIESEIINQNITEILLLDDIDKSMIQRLSMSNISITDIADMTFKEYDISIKCDNKAQSSLLSYLNYMQVGDIGQFQEFKDINIDIEMFIPYQSQKQLEILKTSEDNEYKNSLYWYLNNTSTAMGKRLLKKYITHPLKDKDKILSRQNIVEQYIKNPIVLEETKDTLSNIYDFERLIGRVINNSITPKEVEKLKLSLLQLPYLFSLVNENLDYTKEISPNDLDSMPELAKFLGKSIIEDAPNFTKEGNFIKGGYKEDIDELRKIKLNSNSWLLDFENEEIQKTGIKNLKIKYNKIFGYFIEVTNSNLDLVPDNYVRKQTMANCERYITQELKEEENKILNAHDKLLVLELEVFEEIKSKIKENVLKLQRISLTIAKIDVYTSFATLAINKNLVKPTFNENNTIEIIDGRHPIVEQMTSNYIKNNLVMDNKNIVKIITGPNMSGKSTYMRMLSIIIIMSQIGSFVPAKSANLMIFDGVFTRIGANDNLSKGKSTFMMEMLETNDALKNATKNSLLIFDELGRGTSTHDGISLAKSIINYIVENIKAKTLFSTHYHELIEEDKRYKEVDLIHVKAEDFDGELRFHHKVLPGGTSKSYGIEVASLAGINDTIVNNAKAIYKQLDQKSEGRVVEEVVMQKPYEYEDIIEVIKNIDMNNMTPMESLMLLNEIKGKYEKKSRDNN